MELKDILKGNLTEESLIDYSVHKATTGTEPGLPKEKHVIRLSEFLSSSSSKTQTNVSKVVFLLSTTAWNEDHIVLSKLLMLLVIFLSSTAIGPLLSSNDDCQTFQVILRARCAETNGFHRALMSYIDSSSSFCQRYGCGFQAVLAQNVEEIKTVLSMLVSCHRCLHECIEQLCLQDSQGACSSGQIETTKSCMKILIGELIRIHSAVSPLAGVLAGQVDGQTMHRIYCDEYNERMSRIKEKVTPDKWERFDVNFSWLQNVRSL